MNQVHLIFPVYYTWFSYIFLNYIFLNYIFFWIFFWNNFFWNNFFEIIFFYQHRDSNRVPAWQQWHVSEFIDNFWKMVYLSHKKSHVYTWFFSCLHVIFSYLHLIFFVSTHDFFMSTLDFFTSTLVFFRIYIWFSNSDTTWYKWWRRRHGTSKMTDTSSTVNNPGNGIHFTVLVRAHHKFNHHQPTRLAPKLSGSRSGTTRNRPGNLASYSQVVLIVVVLKLGTHDFKI